MDIKDLAGLSEPASKLIDAFSKAAGVLYEPRRIRLEAQAKADALLTTAQAEIAADSIRRRALDRFVAETVQKQENLESVVAGAARNVAADATGGGDLDPDWVRRFIAEAQEISDASMQAYWSRLLSGEFERPGRYPRRLLRLLKDLDPKDAELIERTAPHVLTVETNDSNAFSFLISYIEQQTVFPDDDGGDILMEGEVPGAALLEELGLVNTMSSLFNIAIVSGPESGHLMPAYGSARRIFAGVHLAQSGTKQNAQAGIQINSAGGPGSHAFHQTLTFEGYRLTSLGESMFDLVGIPAVETDLRTLKEVLETAGIGLDYKAHD